MIVSIDGLAGTGKTSVTNYFVKNFFFLKINTGLDYRKLTYFNIFQNLIINSKNRKKIEKKLYDKITKKQLFCKEVTENVNKIASLKFIRLICINKSKKIIIENKHKNIIIEGRDAGNNIYAQINCKIYLKCSLDQRVKRRILQKNLKYNKKNYNLEKINLIQRDRGEINFDKKDKFIIDTSNIKFDEVCKKITFIIKKFQ